MLAPSAQAVCVSALFRWLTVVVVVAGVHRGGGGGGVDRGGGGIEPVVAKQ